MKRREFVQAVGVVSATGRVSGCEPPAETTSADAGSPAAGSEKAGAQSADAQARRAPDWVKSLRDSDLDGLAPVGKPIPGYKATGTGHAGRGAG